MVGLDLAEVGIGSRVDDELVCEYQVGVQAHLPEGGSTRVEDVVRIVQVKFLERARNAVGYELNVPARRNFLQTGSRALLIEPSLDAAGIRRPEGVFTRAGNLAVQQDSPGLRVAGGEAQAAKRDRKPYHKTSMGSFHRRVPDRIERWVEILTLRPNGIRLHTQRICQKGVGVPMVMEGIEHDLDCVVVEDVLAP